MDCILDIKDQETRGRSAQNPLAGDEIYGEPRIAGPFPARVKSLNARGRCRRADAELESLSGGDFCVRLRERVEPGERLFVTARINHAVVALRGTVVAVSPRAEGFCGATARITKYRFVRRHTDSNSN